MEIQFATRNTRVITDLNPVNYDEFVHLLKKYKPKTIYNNEWSSEKPFIEITSYSEDGLVMYCNGLADKTPEEKTFLQLYDSLKYCGLSDCFFNVGGPKV